MKLIVGFGNPESKYNFTRHNFGFLTLDFYAKIKNLSWEKTDKFNSIWLKTDISSLNVPGDKKNPNKEPTSDREQIIFIKPQTYYNEVGRAIQSFAHFYKISPEDILIICDDFNLSFGKIRFREKGSAGGNNGLKSTIKELGTDSFPRLRLGTDNNIHQKSGDINFVLGKFTTSEKEKLPEILRTATNAIDDWLK